MPRKTRPDQSPPRPSVPAPEIAGPLLDWYDRSRRSLPWRAEPGRRPDPYHVWLSEIMLQQTTVPAVKGYFARFLDRWPTVEALAMAERDQVMTEWAGLGYYARARNLHACARIVAEEHGGRFPETEEALRALPGIGRYTAAAIAAIAFDRRAAVMDANVERVIARLFRVEEPLPGVKDRLYALTDLVTPARRAGDFAQAMMDLGATICAVRTPRCMLCPISAQCTGKEIAEGLPAKAAKKAKPKRKGLVWWIERADGAILLRKRPDRGLLGGMMEIPSSEWLEDGPPDDASPPLPLATERPLFGTVRHVFTHFELELRVRVGRSDAPAPPACIWVLPDRLGEYALPTVMLKVVKLALTR